MTGSFNDDDLDEFEREFRKIRNLIESMFEDMFRSHLGELDEDVFKRLATDPKTKLLGFSVRIGPDGKPILREFGNIKPSRHKVEISLGDVEGEGGDFESIGIGDEREPLVDVFETKNGKCITVIAEVPGVDKDEISLTATEQRLVIRATNQKHRYYREIELPNRIDPDSAKASYKNGVLTVELKKKSGKTNEKKKKIHID